MLAAFAATGGPVPAGWGSRKTPACTTLSHRRAHACMHVIHQGKKQKAHVITEKSSNSTPAHATGLSTIALGYHRVLITLLQPHDQGWRRAKPGWRRCGRSARRRSGHSACPRRKTRSTALQTSRPCYSWSRRRACLPRSGTGHTGYTQLCDVVERFSQCWLAIFQASLCAFTVFLS